MIFEDLLSEFGGELMFFAKGAGLFTEGHVATHFFQVSTGEVKMYNFNEEGKEFIQGIFTDGDSFGEPPLLNDQLYLTNAAAMRDSEIWMMGKPDFLRMISSENSSALATCRRLADRLYYKSLMSAEISTEDPEHRLLRFFDFLKHNVAHCDRTQKYHINLTRQQLADLTGLRVETVIRAVKALEKKNAVSIVDRKIFR